MSEVKTIDLQYLVRFRSGQDYKHVQDDAGEVPVIGSGGPFTAASDHLYDGESVLFGRKGTIDRPLYINGRFWTVDTMFYTELSEKIVGRWLYYWATTVPFKLYSTDTALPSMTSSTLGRLKVPVLSVDTQRRIADYLDRETGEIDAMIDKLGELADNLKSRKSAFLDNAFDELYEKKTAPLWSILEPVKDQGYPDEEVLSVYRDYGVILKSSRDDNLNRTPDNLNPYQLVLPGDVVINKMKTWQGSLGVSEYRGIVSPDYQVARPTTDLEHRYIHWVLRAPRMISQYRNRSIGVRPAQWRLYWDEMSTLHVPVPPLNDQRRIADHLDDVTSKIDAMLAKVAQFKDLLTERRAAVITDVVTGRKDVA